MEGTKTSPQHPLKVNTALHVLTSRFPRASTQQLKILLPFYFAPLSEITAPSPGTREGLCPCPGSAGCIDTVLSDSSC